MFKRNKDHNKMEIKRKKTIICPYCMGEIKPDEILFMTDGGTGKDDVFQKFADKFLYSDCHESGEGHMGQIIDQKDNSIEIEYNEDTKFPMAVVMERNGGERRRYTKRICHHCHCYLVDGIEYTDIKNIVVLGGTSCGKTTFLSALLHEAIGDDTGAMLSGLLGRAKIEGDSKPYLDKYIKNWKNGERDATLTGRNLFPIVFSVENINRTNRVIITIHDFAGEGMRDSDYFANHPIATREIDGVFLMIDACQLSNYQKYKIENACAIKITKCIEFTNAAIKKLRKVNSIAVVLNKFDIIMEKANKTDNPTVAYEPTLSGHHKEAVSTNAIKGVSQTVREIIRKDGGEFEAGALIPTIESLFDKKWQPNEELNDLEYFAVSTMGLTKHEKGEGHEEYYSCEYHEDRALHRVLEPLLYFLARWRIFESK